MNRYELRGHGEIPQVSLEFFPMGRLVSLSIRSSRTMLDKFQCIALRSRLDKWIKELDQDIRGERT